MSQKSALEILKELVVIEMGHGPGKVAIKEPITLNGLTKYPNTINGLTKDLDDITTFIGSNKSKGRSTSEIKKNFENAMSQCSVKEKLAYLVDDEILVMVNEKRNGCMTCVYYLSKDA